MYRMKIPLWTLRSGAFRSINAWMLIRVPGAARLIPAMGLPAGESFGAFLETLRRVRNTDPTRCEGWTVHELLAHLAAGSAEIADLANLPLQGVGPVRATRGFEEREAPYRLMRPMQLRRSFVREGMRATAAIIMLEQAGRDLEFTGIALSPQSLLLHCESELIVHRWDITGDDDVSLQGLARRDIQEHTLTTIAKMPVEILTTTTAPSDLDAAHQLLAVWGR